MLMKRPYDINKRMENYRAMTLVTRVAALLERTPGTRHLNVMSDKSLTEQQKVLCHNWLTSVDLSAVRLV